MTIAGSMTPNAIHLFVDGKMHTIGKDHVNYDRIREAIAVSDHPDRAIIGELADVPAYIAKWASDPEFPDFRVEHDVLYYQEYAYPSIVSDKILAMIEEGHDSKALLRFLTKVENNPSSTARDELLLFCVANGFLIHEDGDIIAYKSTGEDYLSIHSGADGKVRYMVGDEPSMPRNRVDDRRHYTCSFGLHFAAKEYASSWAGSSIKHVMVVKVNPADVVSIPNDYGNQKARCSRMLVIDEVHNFKERFLEHREVYKDRDFSAEGQQTIARDRLRHAVIDHLVEKAVYYGIEDGEYLRDADLLLYDLPDDGSGSQLVALYHMVEREFQFVLEYYERNVFTHQKTVGDLIDHILEVGNTAFLTPREEEEEPDYYDDEEEEDWYDGEEEDDSWDDEEEEGDDPFGPYDFISPIGLLHEGDRVQVRTDDSDYYIGMSGVVHTVTENDEYGVGVELDSGFQRWYNALHRPTPCTCVGAYKNPFCPTHKRQ